MSAIGLRRTGPIVVYLSIIFLKKGNHTPVILEGYSMRSWEERQGRYVRFRRG
jgi:hypothetical protein